MATATKKRSRFAKTPTNSMSESLPATEDDYVEDYMAPIEELLPQEARQAAPAAADTHGGYKGEELGNAHKSRQHWIQTIAKDRLY